MRTPQEILKEFRPSEFGRSFLLWTTACLCGVAIAFFAEAHGLAERWAHKIGSLSPQWFFIVTPLGFWLSWYLVVRLAPEAGGSGIPQVMSAISHEENIGCPIKQRLIGLKTAVVKILSCLVLTLSGGAVGREGPSIQVATSLFLLAARHASQYVQGIQIQQWIIAGAGAGLAAAFNTPLGGIVFVIEELVHGPWFKLKSQLLGCIIIAGYTSFYLQGNYLYLGFPGLGNIKLYSVFSGIMIGVVSGFAGALFSRLIIHGQDLKIKLTEKLPQNLQPLVLGLILAFFLQSYSNVIIGGGREIIMEYLFHKHSANWEDVLARFFAPIITYLSGGAGGVFAPGLAAGASIGAIVHHLFPAQNQELFVLLGMIGFLTGITRAPFTSFILVFEMTDKHHAILPMMTAALAAFWAARIVSPKGFYEILSERVEERVKKYT